MSDPTNADLIKLLNDPDFLENVLTPEEREALMSHLAHLARERLRVFDEHRNDRMA